MIRDDLFDRRTKEQKLEEWCRIKKIFSSHDINFYGTTHFFDSATRRIREWTKEGKVMKIFNPNSKIALYRYIENINA